MEGETSNDTGCPSSACSLSKLSQTGTSRSGDHNVEQKLFNPVTFKRFLQESSKFLTAMSQTDLRSNKKWKREIATKEEEAEIIEKSLVLMEIKR